MIKAEALKHRSLDWIERFIETASAVSVPTLIQYEDHKIYATEKRVAGVQMSMHHDPVALGGLYAKHAAYNKDRDYRIMKPSRAA